jgi:hypothetical protein
VSDGQFAIGEVSGRAPGAGRPVATLAEGCDLAAARLRRSARVARASAVVDVRDRGTRSVGFMRYQGPREGIVAFGTMHRKGQVVAPSLAPLGLDVVEVPIDTDAFGKFTRDVPRAGTQRDAARAKALAALAERADAAFGLGSEGAFGPHPAAPFLPGGVEVLVLVSRDGAVCVEGIDVTFDVRHRAARLDALAPLDDVLSAIGLPDHAAVVAPPPPMTHDVDSPPLSDARAGLRDASEVRAVASDLLDAHGAFWVESDMRAHMNPTRMRAIGRAASDLAHRWASACPSCGRPGFAVVERIGGLPCRACGAPTGAIRLERSVCPCGHEAFTPAAPALADPSRCPWCNP